MGNASVRGVFVARAVATAGLILFAASGACSFATNTTVTQCTSEAECLSLGPEFAGTTCDPATRTCVPVAENTDLCGTNVECAERAGGLPAICRKRDRRCVVLTTPECPTVLQQPGQLLDDDVIVIGAITPAGHTELGDNMDKALELAQADFSKQVRGLPPLPGAGADEAGDATRPLVIVSCREFGAGGYSQMIRGANHLADNVDVPIVIGPVDPSSAAKSAQEVFNPKRIVSILPAGTNTALKTLPNPIAPTPLIWSNSYTDEGIAIANAEFVTSVLIPRIRAEGVTGPIRIAQLYEDNFLGRNAADLTESKLNFNGMTAALNADPAKGGNYLRLSVGDLIDPVGNPAPESKVAQAIGAVIGFRPHIVLHAISPAAIPPAFFNLVFNYPQSEYPPLHVDIVATFGVFQPVYEVIDTLSNPAIPEPFRLRNRFYSMTGRDDPATDARRSDWILKFRSQYPQFRQSPSPTSALVQAWYDAAYVAAYAIVGTGSKPLTGENLAATLPLLNPPGTVIQTDTAEISKAFGLLQSGQGIDLVGLTGDLNIDPRTGFVNYDVAVTCPFVGPDGKTVGFKASGFYTEGGSGRGAVTGCASP